MTNGKSARAPSVQAALTDHEVATALGSGAQSFHERMGQLVQTYEAASADVDSLEAELDAALAGGDGDNQVYDEQTPAQRNNAYARGNFRALTELIGGRFTVFLGFVMLSIGGIAIPVVDASMFYNLFAHDFENEFREVSSTEAWLVGLFSMQALGTFLAAKFFINTPERRAMVAALVFVGGLLFSVGAALERAEQKIADSVEYSETDVGFTWDQPQAAPADGAAETQTHLGAYLLSLGFITLPLLGALMLSAGWEAFTSGRVQVEAVKTIRKAFRMRKFAVARKSATAAQMKAFAAARDTLVRKPLDNKVGTIIARQRALKEAARQARQSGLAGIVDIANPHDPSARLTDIDGVEAEADAAIEAFGNGYCDELVAAWHSRKSPG